MTEIKQQALDVLNVELGTDHSQALDTIHNWICDQDDDELFKNILKPGKSLKDALNFVASKVRQQAVNGCAVLDDNSVFKMVVEYFAGEATAIKTIANTATVGEKKEFKRPVYENTAEGVKKVEPAKMVESKKTKANVSMNMSIFDFIETDPEEAEEDEDVDVDQG